MYYVDTSAAAKLLLREQVDMIHVIDENGAAPGRLQPGQAGGMMGAGGSPADVRIPSGGAITAAKVKKARAFHRRRV